MQQGETHSSSLPSLHARFVSGWNPIFVDCGEASLKSACNEESEYPSTSLFSSAEMEIIGNYLQQVDIIKQIEYIMRCLNSKTPKASH